MQSSKSVSSRFPVNKTLSHDESLFSQFVTPSKDSS